MDYQKILIANLSKDEIGEVPSTIIGSILVTSIQLSALYRAKKTIDKRIPFYLYVDEAHSFISLSLADILVEAQNMVCHSFSTSKY